MLLLLMLPPFSPLILIFDAAPFRFSMIIVRRYAFAAFFSARMLS